MILRALITEGILDMSSQEQLQGELSTFRGSMRPGDILEVPDELRGLANIDSAIASGLLEVIEFDDAPGSLVVNAELDTTGGGGTLDDLFLNETPVESPNGSIKTFTLPSSKKYVSGKVLFLINGQVAIDEDFDENGARTTITLKAAVPAPLADDNLRFLYVKSDT